MPDQVALAYVNLRALLRDIEDLVALDAEAASIVAGRAETIGFMVRGGPRGKLSFGQGACRFHEAGAGPRTTIGLWFPNPSAFNAMVAGTGNPVPYKGLLRLGFLTGPFTRLAKRLETVLKAGPEALAADPGLAATQAELLLYAAAFAVAEIGRHDPVGALNAARIPDGVIEIGVEGGPAVSIEAKGGVLSTRKGRVPNPRAYMTFVSLAAARALFAGEIDAMVALGEGSVGIRGYIPMVEHMNKVLGLAPRYLG